eukprot:scaffold76875_cov62-Phaeocystis_antarctica.AAC.4
MGWPLAYPKLLQPSMLPYLRAATEKTPPTVSCRRLARTQHQPSNTCGASPTSLRKPRALRSRSQALG